MTLIHSPFAIRGLTARQPEMRNLQGEKPI